MSAEARHERRLLGLLGAASFFSQYDEGLLALLLVQIQADLGIAEADLGLLGSLVRLGALPAFGLLLAADRVGRRRMLFATIAGYTLFTAATALAPGFGALVALQFGARLFVTAELLLAMVVIVEEFPPGRRGFGIGILGSLALLGRGFSVALFGAIEVIPFGWRGLYALGVLPLLAITLLRRSLRETRRFEASRGAQEPRRSLAGWLAPVAALARHYPMRLASVVTVGFFWSFSNGPVDFFLPKYFQQVLGWSPRSFSLLAIGGGAIALGGHVAAGWASDRHGRRRVLLFFTVVEPLVAIALYTVLGPGVAALFVLWMCASIAADVVGDTYGKELFPTSARGTAAGLSRVAVTLGSVLGLAVEAALFARFGAHWAPVRLVAATGLAVPLVAWLAYPETAGRTLEEISPESPSDARRERHERVAAREPVAVARGAG